MDILRIIGIALITMVATLVVKQIKAEFSIIVSLAGALVILFMIVDGLSSIVDYFNEIIIRTSINSEFFTIILKVVGVGYLTEFASNLCVDGGMKSLADKITISGKIIIVVLSLPIITGLLDIVTEILK